MSKFFTITHPSPHFKSFRLPIGEIVRLTPFGPTDRAMKVATDALKAPDIIWQHFLKGGSYLISNDRTGSCAFISHEKLIEAIAAVKAGKAKRVQIKPDPNAPPPYET